MLIPESEMVYQHIRVILTPSLPPCHSDPSVLPTCHSDPSVRKEKNLRRSLRIGPAKNLTDSSSPFPLGGAPQNDISKQLGE